MKPIHIFKAGRHTAADGKTYDFSEADMVAAAAAYDPAVHEAPIVLGHPKGDAPAYGWAQSLVQSAGDLEAIPHQVDPDFAEAFNAKRFKKISASFYLPDSPNNPKPGVLYLRHIGVLGAQVPAIKGLRQAEFAEGESGVVDFADWSEMRLAGMFRSLRDWIIGKFGQDEADKALASWDVTGAQIDAATASDETTNTASYSEQETTMNAELKARQAALDARELQIQQREDATKKLAADARTASFSEFVSSLVKDGRLLPAHQAGLVEFMASEAETGVVEFGEGDKRVSTPRVEWLKNFLSGLPTAVDFSERASAKIPAPSAPFNAPAGATVDSDGAELHSRIVEFAEKNDLTYEAALTAVVRQAT